MVLLREAQVGSPQPLTERQILSEVLGERRGHVRGVGRKIGSSSSSASQSSVQSRPAERPYTQAEVDAMMRLNTPDSRKRYVLTRTTRRPSMKP